MNSNILAEGNEFNPDSASLSFHGFIVQAPASESWKILEQTKFNLTLSRYGSNRYETYGAKVAIMQTREKYSDDQIFNKMKSKFLLRERTEFKDRYKILLNDSTTTNEKETFCMSFYSKARDYKPSKKPDDISFLITETIERIYRHPYDSKIFISTGFSQRFVPNESEKDFKAQAQRFLDSIKMEPF